MNLKLFKPKDVEAITGESNKRLNYWVARGLLEPADKGGGVGSARRYSFKNLLEVMIVRDLWRSIPNNVDEISRILNYLRKNYPTFFKDELCKDPKFGDNILLIMRDWQGITNFMLADIQSQIEVVRDVVPAGQHCILISLDMVRMNLLRGLDASK